MHPNEFVDEKQTRFKQYNDQSASICTFVNTRCRSKFCNLISVENGDTGRGFRLLNLFYGIRHFCSNKENSLLPIALFSRRWWANIEDHTNSSSKSYYTSFKTFSIKVNSVFIIRSSQFKKYIWLKQPWTPVIYEFSKLVLESGTMVHSSDFYIENLVSE